MITDQFSLLICILNDQELSSASVASNEKKGVSIG